MLFPYAGKPGLLAGLLLLLCRSLLADDTEILLTGGYILEGLPHSWLALSCATCASPTLAEWPVLAAALTLPSAGGPPRTVTLTSLGLMVDGIPVLAIAILPPCCVCLPHYSCAPPSYCEHTLVSPQCRRTAALANSFFSRGGLSDHSLFGPGDQSGPSG